MDHRGEGEGGPRDPGRRRALGWLSRAAMAAGLAAGYGTFGALLARFVYPARPPRRDWLLVGPVHELAPGAAVAFRTPAGATVTVTHQGEGLATADFRALSSVCPHLGCQVHWQPRENRFFCPCHNGIFTPEGKGIGGPPGDAGLDLPSYPLEVRDGLLFLQAPADELAAAGGGGRAGSG